MTQGEKQHYILLANLGSGFQALLRLVKYLNIWALNMTGLWFWFIHLQSFNTLKTCVVLHLFSF